jgi:hypothetical protein
MGYFDLNLERRPVHDDDDGGGDTLHELTIRAPVENDVESPATQRRYERECLFVWPWPHAPRLPETDPCTGAPPLFTPSPAPPSPVSREKSARRSARSLRSHSPSLYPVESIPSSPVTINTYLPIPALPLNLGVSLYMQ